MNQIINNVFLYIASAIYTIALIVVLYFNMASHMSLNYGKVNVSAITNNTYLVSGIEDKSIKSLMIINNYGVNILDSDEFIMSKNSNTYGFLTTSAEMKDTDKVYVFYE